MPDETTATIFRRWSERFPEAVPTECGREMDWSTAYGPSLDIPIKEPDALRRILWACVEWCDKNNHDIVREHVHGGIVMSIFPPSTSLVTRILGRSTDPRPAESAMLAMLALPKETT